MRILALIPGIETVKSVVDLHDQPTRKQHGARGGHSSLRQSTERGLPARSGANLQHHSGAGHGRRVSGGVTESTWFHRRGFRPVAPAAHWVANCCCGLTILCTRAMRSRTSAKGQPARCSAGDYAQNLGMTVICDDLMKIEGIFTDGDLRRVFDMGGDVRSMGIAEVMTPRRRSRAPEYAGRRRA